MWGCWNQEQFFYGESFFWERFKGVVVGAFLDIEPVMILASIWKWILGGESKTQEQKSLCRCCGERTGNEEVMRKDFYAEKQADKGHHSTMEVPTCTDCEQSFVFLHYLSACVISHLVFLLLLLDNTFFKKMFFSFITLGGRLATSYLACWWWILIKHWGDWIWFGCLFLNCPTI